MITIQVTRIFDEWMRHLKDKQAVVAIAVRIRRAEDGNFGDVKPVGEGVSEMRIHVGAGYRVYFKKIGVEVVVLLAGGVNDSMQRHQGRA